jgi:hypothetical protein
LRIAEKAWAPPFIVALLLLATYVALRIVDAWASLRQGH